MRCLCFLACVGLIAVLFKTFDGPIIVLLLLWAPRLRASDPHTPSALLGSCLPVELDPCISALIGFGERNLFEMWLGAGSVFVSLRQAWLRDRNTYLSCDSDAGKARQICDERKIFAHQAVNLKLAERDRPKGRVRFKQATA